VAFGARVTVLDPDGTEQTYEITGEDEADAPQGRIAPQSPLARALMGARLGDTVVWARPAGRTELEITAITYGAP
jgi:transcription elongation factor GreB